MDSIICILPAPPHTQHPNHARYSRGLSSPAALATNLRFPWKKLLKLAPAASCSAHCIHTPGLSRRAGDLRPVTGIRTSGEMSFEITRRARNRRARGVAPQPIPGTWRDAVRAHHSGIARATGAAQRRLKSRLRRVFIIFYGSKLFSVVRYSI